MPVNLVYCITLPDATRSSVPIFDFVMANENEELASMSTVIYYPCCGKNICEGCLYSFQCSGNENKCPFCNSDRGGKTDEDGVEDSMMRAEANDAASIYLLANSYHNGENGLVQDRETAIELYVRAAELGCSDAHSDLGNIYRKGGDLKRAKFHWEAAAMAGHEIARFHLGIVEAEYGNIERAVKHFTIGASGGDFLSMHALQTSYEKGYVTRESIDSTLVAYNNACVEMRSEARDARIRSLIQIEELLQMITEHTRNLRTE
jgi:TPR repeat protein